MLNVYSLIGLVVAVCTAYDFSNSDFNEVILESYENLKSTNLGDSQLIRVNRDTKEPMENICMEKRGFFGARCCDEQTNTQAKKMFKIYQEQCVKELYGYDDEDDYHYDPFSCENIEEMKERYICTAECLGWKLNIIHANYTVDRDLLVDVQKQFTGTDSDWRHDIADKIADKCVARLEEVKNFTGKCNPTGAWIFFCMWKEYVLACPKELQMNTRRCDRMRERLEKQTNPLSGGFYVGRRFFHKHQQ